MTPPKSNSEVYRDLVIQLHDIARQVESEIGRGKLSDDLRNCADRLHAILVKTWDDGK